MSQMAAASSTYMYYPTAIPSVITNLSPFGTMPLPMSNGMLANDPLLQIEANAYSSMQMYSQAAINAMIPMNLNNMPNTQGIQVSAKHNRTADSGTAHVTPTTVTAPTVPQAINFRRPSVQMHSEDDETNPSGDSNRDPDEHPEPIPQTKKPRSSSTTKQGLSRHVSSVISHFTSSREGYRRLMNEIDDFLHVISGSGAILFCSPSVKKYLQVSTDSDLVGKQLFDIVHRDDVQFVRSRITSAIQGRKEEVFYCRYMKKPLQGGTAGKEGVLLHVRCRPFGISATSSLSSATSVSSDNTGGHASQPSPSQDNTTASLPRPDNSSPFLPTSYNAVDQSLFSNTQVNFLILSAREYTPTTIDTIIELRMEHLKLRRQLERKLLDRGIDPKTHPLLQEDESGRVLGGTGPPPQEVTAYTREMLEAAANGEHDEDDIVNDADAQPPMFLRQNSVSRLQQAGLYEMFPGDDYPQGSLIQQGESPRISIATSNLPEGMNGPMRTPTGGSAAVLDVKKKKRKKPVPDSADLFCRQCGTTTSPEWRRGPEGPKTLCNACGLAFSKRNRKSTKKKELEVEKVVSES